MTIARYVQDEDIIDYTPTSGGADVSAGDVVVQNDLVAIAKLDIPAGTLGALAVTGVFDIAKSTAVGSAIAAGAKTYWDQANKQATANDGGGANDYIGKAVAAAADADETVRVRLCP